MVGPIWNLHNSLWVPKRDLGQLTLDPQPQGQWIDGFGIRAIYRSHWDRRGLDAIAFERTPKVRLHDAMREGVSSYLL